MPADASHQIGQSVGARMRAARLAKKYTQNQLARPDFSVSYVSAIERGQIQPSLRALEILAQRLELSPTDLLPAHATLTSQSTSETRMTTVGSEEQELLLLEARIAIHQGNPAQASESLQRFLPRRGERRQEKASMLYYVLGWAYLVEGRAQESEQLLAEAARAAKDSADPFYPCILSLQSAVYMLMHNTEQAMQLRRESLRVLKQQAEVTNNVFFLAQLHSSVAQHYSYLGEFEQANEQFRQTLHLLHVHLSCQQLQDGYWNLVSDYTKKELYSLANLYAYKWHLANFRCQLTSIRSEIEYALGRALLRSDPTEAHRYVLSISREAEARQDQLSQAGANVQLASWLMTHDESGQAEQLVQLAQKQGSPFGETLISADAQVLAGELAYRRQDYIAGDKYFESGLAMLKQVGAREDLLEQFARYAQLLEDRGCLAEALVYWKLAYDYEGHQNNYATSSL